MNWNNWNMIGSIMFSLRYSYVLVAGGKPL